MAEIKIETGRRYMAVMADGTIKINKVPKTTTAKPLDPESNWLICKSGDDIVYTGQAIPTEVVALTDGTNVNFFTNEEEYYNTALTLAIPFGAGLLVKKGGLYSYAGSLYTVVQAHTTQADWTPDIVPALFSKIQAPGSSGYPDWIQKYAPPYYQIGDRVTHNEKNWECVAGDADGNNVWEPGVFGWNEI